MSCARGWTQEDRVNQVHSLPKNCNRVLAALVFYIASFSAADARGAASAEGLRSDTLAVEISDQGYLTNLRQREDSSRVLGSPGVGAPRLAGWYRGAEQLAVVPASVRRSASRFEAELAHPVHGRLVYSLSGSVLTVELQASAGSLPANLRFELPNTTVDLHVEDRFVGMAGYLNGFRAVHLSPEGELDGVALPHAESDSFAGEWIGRKSRYSAALVEATDATIRLSEDGTVIEWKEAGEIATLQIYLGTPTAESARASDLAKNLRYGHLWSPLRVLCLGIEWVLLGIYGITGNWGVAIIVTSLVMRVMMLPINKRVSRYQQEVNANTALLEPLLADIKRKYKGAKASEAILAAHKSLGITPFHALKPTLGIMLQLPILVGVFNVFGELEAIRGNGFLWISDLSYPDTIASLPFELPIFGSAVNFLPMLMTAVSVFSSSTLKPIGLPETSLRSQRRSLYWMAAVFFLLFYSFPASMALLWTTTNVLQLIQQTISQRKRS